MFIIKNATLITLQEENPVLSGDLIVSNDRISYVGPSRDHGLDFEKIIDGKDFIVIPGFANTHTHLAMTYFRGYASNVPLKEWLEKYIFPVEDRMTEEQVYFGTLLACIESIRTGTTLITDFYMFPTASIRAIKETGLRANVGFAFASRPGMDTLTLNRAESFFSKYSNTENGRIAVSFAPHASYTCTPSLLKRTAILAREVGAIVQIHLHETQHEVKSYSRKQGKTPIMKLEEIGFFKARVLASHCVHITAEEAKILRDNGTGVCINPQSNLKLGSGIPNIEMMFKTGIRLSIGTDGPASNNNLSVLEDVRLAALLAKGMSQDPSVIGNIEAVKMATLNGALNTGFSECGMLKEGFKADFIMVRKGRENLIPETDFVEHILYSMYPKDVDYVFVDGKMVMENGKILSIDEESVKKEFNKQFKKLFGVSQQ